MRVQDIAKKGIQDITPAEASALVAAANKRLKRLESAGMEMTPTYAGVQARMGTGKLSLKGSKRDRGIAIHEAQKIMQAKTGTVSGVKKEREFLTPSQGGTFGAGTGSPTPDTSGAWGAFRRAMERDAATVAQYGSETVREMMKNIYEDRLDRGDDVSTDSIYGDLADQLGTSAGAIERGAYEYSGDFSDDWETFGDDDFNPFDL